MPGLHRYLGPALVYPLGQESLLHREPLTAMTPTEPSALSEWTEWFTARRFAALLGLLIVASFAPILFGGQSFFLRDFGYFSYPIAHYHRECFWRGELLPLWNPYSSCGTPFLAQWNTLILYPPALIYLLLPLPWSLNFFCLLHLFVAGLGMYALARDWTGNRFAASVAGILFTFNGFTLNGLMWPHIIAALAAVPWIVLTARRAWLNGGRAVFIALIPGTLQMLTGAPEIILVTWLFVGCVWLADAVKISSVRTRGLARLLGVVLFVAGISAAQLLPFFELAAASDRSVSSTGGAWSMPSWGWANLFVPLFHNYRMSLGVFFQTDQYWISSYYPCISGLLFAIVAAVLTPRNGRVWMLFAIACVSMSIALGENGFVYPLIRQWAPQLSLIRFPVKFVAPLVIAVPLLAAYGVSAWLENPTLRQNRTAVFASASSLIVIITGLVWWARFHPARAEIWTETLWSGASRALLVMTLTAVMIVLARAERSRTQLILGAAALVILFIDGKTHSPNANATILSVALEPGLVRLDPAPSLGGYRAMLTRAMHDEVNVRMISNPVQDYLLHRQTLMANCNLLDHIPTVIGFYPLYVRTQREAWAQFWFTQTNVIKSPFLDFLGVAHVSAPDSKFEWTNRTTALPLATVGQQPVFADAQNTLDALVSPSFEPSRTVYLPLEAKPFVSATNRTEARVTAQHFDTHRSRFTVEAKENSLFVLAQSFYGPWRARVDGNAATIFRANHGFQSVLVPAGTREIVFTYEDRAFRAGGIISLLTLALAVTLAWRFPKWF
jgi:hypothetical protein